MTSEPRDIGIKSFEDVDRGGYKVLTLPFGYQPYGLIANAPEGSAKRRIHNNKMHEVVSVGSVLQSNLEMIRRVKQDPKVLAFGGVVVGMSMERNLIALGVADAAKLFKSMALQKNSEFSTLINHQIMMMIESGKLERIKYQWEGKHEENYEVEEAIVLGYEHVLFPYSLLALGMTMSVPIILAEWMAKRLAKTRLMKVIPPAAIGKGPIDFAQLKYEYDMLAESLKSEREANAKLEAKTKAMSMEMDLLKEQLRLNLPNVS